MHIKLKKENIDKAKHKKEKQSKHKSLILHFSGKIKNY